MNSIQVGGATLSVVQGDITKLEVDVIVNAANEHLSHGGGVAAAISHAGGPVVQQESHEWVRQHGPVGRGRAAITSAGGMPAKHVVHVVGPGYRGTPDDEHDLRAAVRAALTAAEEVRATSLAIPALSTGVYGYPTQAATGTIVQQIVDWLVHSDTGLNDIRLVGYDADTAAAFSAALDSVDHPG